MTATRERLPSKPAEVVLINAMQQAMRLAVWWRRRKAQEAAEREQEAEDAA